MKSTSSNRAILKMSTKIAFFLAPLVLLACNQMTPASAIFNCFPQNMFKMPKGQMFGPDRANWYPQHSFQPGYPMQMGYGQSPMKLLFQPKWRGGSLFGSKGWNSWRSGSNFYRPGLGYGPPFVAMSGAIPINEQLNVAPFVLPTPMSSYSSSNDGWSAPMTYSQVTPIQQAQLNNYDSYTPSSLKPSKIISPVIDQYGIKGPSKISTTKNILLADGGYSSYDTHIVNGLKNHSYGYTYPEWYSGSFDSPSKIAQQLFKYNLRKQRLQSQNISGSLLEGPWPAGDTTSQFTILDEPKFVGFGTVDSLNTREARLSCSFNEPIDQTNRPLWIKFLGPYNSSQIVESKIIPPFNCASSLCRTQEIETTKDYRYRFDNGPATSTLIISEPRASDYGIYRCSALTKVFKNNPLETIYQIVQFNIK